MRRINATYTNTGSHPLDIGLIIKSGMSVREVSTAFTHAALSRGAAAALIHTNYTTSVDVNEIYASCSCKNIHGEWKHVACCLKALMNKYCGLITPQLPATMLLL